MNHFTDKIGHGPTPTRPHFDYNPSYLHSQSFLYQFPPFSFLLGKNKSRPCNDGYLDSTPTSTEKHHKMKQENVAQKVSRPFYFSFFSTKSVEKKRIEERKRDTEREAVGGNPPDPTGFIECGRMRIRDDRAA